MAILNEKKKVSLLVILSVIACIIMFFIEKYLHPGFFLKSILKIAVFLSSVAIYYKVTKDKFDLLGLKDLNRTNFYRILRLGLVVFIFILIGYYFMKNYIDLDNIKENLLSKEGITKDNFIFVSIYISVVNSLLEEFFFRGHIFGKLKSLNYKKLGYIFSPILFSLYHIAIIDSWFTPALFGLFVIGLVVVGVFFNFIMEKANSFLAPWIVHAFANLGINTIGFIMLGVL